MISLILFDMDGTIVDTEPLAHQAIMETTQLWNLPVSKEDAASVSGKKWEVAVELISQKYGLPMPFEEATKAIVKRYREILPTHLIVVPGVVEAIHEFSQNFELALVSGSHRADVLWVLKTLKVDHLFKVILGAEDYPKSKPAPDGYQKALQILGKQPSDGLVFEDSSPGIASAKGAGIKVVVVSSTNHFHQNLDGANKSIPDFRGINSAWVKANF